MKIKFFFVGILLTLTISKILSFEKSTQQNQLKPNIEKQQVIVSIQKNFTGKQQTQTQNDQAILITKQNQNKKRIVQDSEKFLGSPAGNEDDDDEDDENDEENELDLNQNEDQLADFSEDPQDKQNLSNENENNLSTNTSSVSTSTQSSRKNRSKTAKIIGLLFLSGLFIGFGFFLYNLYTCTKKKEPTIEFEEEMEDANILQINNKSDDNLKQ